MSQPSRETRYRRLIRQRRADTTLAQYHFINPVDTRFDPPHVGSFACWADDLYADIVLIITDRRCPEQYTAQHGRPACCTELPDHSLKWKPASGGFLLELLRSIGRDIGTPDDPKPAGVFIADAVPFLGLKDACHYRRQFVYRYCAEHYIIPLLDIINPKIVISVGTGPTRALFHHLNPDTSHVFCDLDLNELETLVHFSPFDIRSGQTALYPVFHTANVCQFKRGNGNAQRGFELMFKDWERIIEKD